jgi:hypothetical protein
MISMDAKGHVDITLTGTRKARARAKTRLNYLDNPIDGPDWPRDIQDMVAQWLSSLFWPAQITTYFDLVNTVAPHMKPRLELSAFGVSGLPCDVSAENPGG